MNRIALLACTACAALAVALFLHFKSSDPSNVPIAKTTAPPSMTASPSSPVPLTAPPADSPADPAPESHAASANPPVAAPAPPVSPPPIARTAPPPAPVARLDMGPLVRNTPPTALPIPQPDVPLIPTEVARAALGLVGADEEAEAVWAAAINDPAMPASVRKDLIEDLNEEGFPDPKNLTEEDLPLILSRLELIEAIALDSMDETNYEAFRESYKDLVNMLNKLNR